MWIILLITAGQKGISAAGLLSPLHFYTSPLLGNGQRAVGFPVICLLFQQQWLLNLLCSPGREWMGHCTVLNHIWHMGSPWEWGYFLPQSWADVLCQAVRLWGCLNGSSQQGELPYRLAATRMPRECSLPKGPLLHGCFQWTSQGALSL